MPPPPVDPGAQALLEHSEWLRALARNLVHDPNLADDLSQEACLVALQRPPGTVFSRAWFATVLRNVLRQERRGDGRREERERRASRDEELPSTLELMTRVSVQRDLAESVMELDEPYRRAILLRYFEGLPPRVIAKRLGVPNATVKTWLQRGLERLRGRLDTDHSGDRRAWAALLLPLTREPLAGGATGTLVTKSIGIALMSTKIKLAAGIVLALGAALLWRGWNASDSSAQGVVSPETELVADAPEGALNDASAEREVLREVVERPDEVVLGVGPASGEGIAAVGPPDVITVRGIVFDSEGSRLSSITLRDADGVEPDVTSGADGEFRLELARTGDRVRLECATEGYSTVYAAHVSRQHPDAQPVVVVAPTLALAGRVIDEIGAPIAEANLRYRLPEGFRSRFGQILDDVQELELLARTEVEGVFAMGDVPLIRDASLVASRDNHVTTSVSLPTFSDEQMTIVLPGVDSIEELVQGQVVDPDGHPVADARVSYGLDVTTTDDAGLFSIPLSDPEGSNARFSRFVDIDTTGLLAVKAGFLPTRAEAPLRSDSGGGVWSEFVRIELTGEPLSISGWVRDENGNGLEGIQVWTNDLMVLGAERRSLRMVEFELRGDDDELDYFVLTDDEGRFELPGLMDRPYALQAMDPVTLRRVMTVPTAAGEEHLEISMPTDGYYEALRGRLVDKQGNGLAGLEIRPMCDAFQTRYRDQVIRTRHETREPVTTDDDGRFVIERVPEDLVYLRIDGNDVIPLEWGRHVEGGLAKLVGDRAAALEIVVGRRCHFRVELADPERADSFSVLDDDGETLVLNVFSATGRSERPVLPLAEGRSDSVAVRDTGMTLVLFKDDEEVARVPLDLVAGELTVVTP